MSLHPDDPHAAASVVTAGPPPKNASATAILLHGRGASAQGMLELYDALNVPGLAAIAPQAADQTWYPHSFLAQIDSNHPHLDSALRRLRTLVDELTDLGIPSERIAILGFSQGACLACEFVARNPSRYGAVMGLTGGLIGPPGTVHSYPGSLSGTHVFLGTSDPDPHVPYQRVEETRIVFEQMGAEVELRRYPGMPHTVNDDEIAACRELLQSISRSAVS